MNSRSAFFVCCLLAVGHGWAKSAVNLPFDGAEWTLDVSLNIGTPPQKVSFVVFSQYADGEPMIVANSPQYPEGMFNRTQSTTFQQLQPLFDHLHNRVGENATDVLTLGDEGLTVELPLRYYDQPFEDVIDGMDVLFDASGFGLTRSTDGQQSFFQTVLEKFEQKTVVFSYDQVLGRPSYNVSGVLTLGGKAEDRCADDWVVQPEVPWSETADQWSMAINEVTFGAYTYDSPGSLRFQPAWWPLAMPQKYQDLLVEAIGVPSWDHVPCDTQLQLVFSVGGKEIRVLPDEYVMSRGDGNGCYVYAADAEQFLLPNTVFRRHCLLLDYSENFSVGFATRLSQM
ncbi:hypothetical protein M3Y99_00827100 [Aphelenchoides fujianensis]|nr:hypothetical protein M3Y99_00827100 [Aphelenchoides fujianensis]